MSRVVEHYLKRREAVRRWIVAVLPDLADVLAEDATEDWLKALSDGVALCLLMKKIRPELVPDIEGTEAPMFLLWANISVFLQALEAMGIHEKQRFKESDLYYKKNLPAVVHTLLELGCLCAKLKIDIPSLPDAYVAVVEEGEEATAHCPPIEEEQITAADLSEFTFPSVLKRLTTWQGTAKAPRSPRKALRSSVHRSKAEEEADPSLKKSAVLLQSFFRMITPRRQLKNRLKKEAYRARVAGEILQTEQLYVDNLNVLVQTFLLPLKDSQDVLGVSHIYAEIEVILAFSTLLLEDLKPIIAAWDHRSCIGEIFLRTCAYMKVYTQYVKDYSLFITALLKAQKSSKFQAALKACTIDVETGVQPFESYLIMPVQRIPRYEMLLKDLHKHTGLDHPDYGKLGSAYQQIKEVALYVNEQKRDFENLMRVIELEKAITEDIRLLEPHRRVVVERDLLALPQEEPRKAILFNDLLVICKPKGKKLGSAKRIELADFTLKELSDTETAQGNFQLHLEDGSTLSFSAMTASDRESFVELLTKQQKTWKSATDTLLEAGEDEEEEEEEEAASGGALTFSKDTDTSKRRRKKSKDTKADARRTLMRGLSTKIEPGTNAIDVLRMFSDANSSLGVEDQFTVQEAQKTVKKERERQKKLSKALDKQLKATSKRSSTKSPGGPKSPATSKSSSSKSSKKKMTLRLPGRKKGRPSLFNKQGSFTTDDVSSISKQYGPQIDITELKSKLTTSKERSDRRSLAQTTDVAAVGKANRKPPPSVRRSLAESTGSKRPETTEKRPASTAPMLSSSEKNRGRHRSKVLTPSSDDIIQQPAEATAVKKVPPPRPERPGMKKRGLRNTMVRQRSRSIG